MGKYLVSAEILKEFTHDKDLAAGLDEAFRHHSLDQFGEKREDLGFVEQGRCAVAHLTVDRVPFSQ